ncbi:MAG: dihydrodipicolinate synthase family protein [SAR324 cluster bacterium]|nr:dihydrodipicolinate synthase family protein [SAR324 cluster bacterium]
MSTTDRIKGVLAPVVTPFKADLSPDPERLLRHCRWLLSQGCDGLAVFGTNSEANSMSVEERLTMLDALVDSGIDPAVLMPGAGCCALSDSVRMAAHVAKLGCAGALMLPPFYYKGVSDDGLYRNFAEIIERVGDSNLRIYLYHIPPVAQVGITLGLIERLVRDYEGVVAGVKDSSGDWNNTKAMLDAGFPQFDVFAGNELILLENMRHGGVGCITATGNVNPAPIHQLYVSWQSPEADAMQEAVSDLRKAVAQFPMIPALKTIVAHFNGDPVWRNLRPPLDPLSDQQAAALIAELEARGFAMTALAA